MKFLKGRVINKIQIPIVRVCNRRCPECCAREQLMWYNKKLREPEIPLEELRQAGRLIGRVPQIEITGGEPTLHSKFEELTDFLPALFQCHHFMLVTNGYLFGKDPSKLPLLLKYQQIYLSHYTENFVYHHGGKTNTAEYMIITKFLKEQKYSGLIEIPMHSHFPYQTPPYRGISCSHFRSDMITCYEGRLFGCCIGWSQPIQGQPIPLTKDWRNHLIEIDLPCEDCFYSNYEV